jgi:Ca2+-binding EF-hand superfamily protein
MDWRTLAASLPVSKSDDGEKKLRLQMFNQFDVGKNGILELQELVDGLQKHLNTDVANLDLRMIIASAFRKAKQVVTPEGKEPTKVVEQREFRLLLQYLKQCLEYKIVFQLIDTNNSGKISLDEFTGSVPAFEELGVEIKDPVAVFSKIDRDSTDTIDFYEFFAWSLGLEYQTNILDTHNALQEEKETNADADADADVDADAYAPGQEEEEKQVEAPPAMDWQELVSLLPVGDTPAMESARISLFGEFDKDHSGSLTLEEMVFQLEKYLKCDSKSINLLFVAQSAFRRAQELSAEDEVPSDSEITISEFPLLLKLLKQCFEYKFIFQLVDQNNNDLLSKDEFLKSADAFREIGVTIAERPLDTFREIDTSDNGSVDLYEFFAWSLKQMYTTSIIDAVEAEKRAEEAAMNTNFLDDDDDADAGEYTAEVDPNTPSAYMSDFSSAGFSSPSFPSKGLFKKSVIANDAGNQSVLASMKAAVAEQEADAQLRGGERTMKWSKMPDEAKLFLNVAKKKYKGKKTECHTCGFRWVRPPGEEFKPCPKCNTSLKPKKPKIK